MFLSIFNLQPSISVVDFCMSKNYGGRSIIHSPVICVCQMLGQPYTGHKLSKYGNVFTFVDQTESVLIRFAIGKFSVGTIDND